MKGLEKQWNGLRQIVRKLVSIMGIKYPSIKSLLFKNLGAKQTVLKNTFWLAIAEGIIRILRFALLVYVARILGASQYGILSFALAFISLFTGSINLVPAKIVIREFAQDRKKENEFSSIILLRILLNFLTVVVIFIGSLFITDDLLIRKVILILAIYTFFDAFVSFLTLIFESRQRMEYTSASKVFRVSMIAILGFLVLIYWPSVENLSYAYLFASFISSIVILLLFHFKVSSLSFNINKDIWKKYLLMSWPLTLAGFFSSIRAEIGSVMMGYLNQINQLGWYSAAWRVIGGASIPLGLVSASFYPLLNQFFRGSKEKFQRAWNYQMEILVILVIPVIFGGILLAPKIIRFFYGSNFDSSILALRILLITFAISFLHGPLSQMLIIFHHQAKIILINFIAAIVSVVSNLILIPHFSLYGAAISTVITSIALWIVYINLISRLTWLKIFSRRVVITLILSFFSAGVMYLIIAQHFLYNLHVVLSTVIGATIYFIILFGIRYLLDKLNHHYIL